VKDWRPHVDLRRLLAALGEELCTVTDDEVREVCGVAGQPMAAVARDIRKRIAAASGTQDEPGPPPADAAYGREHCWRHN